MVIQYCPNKGLERFGEGGSAGRGSQTMSLNMFIAKLFIFDFWGTSGPVGIGIGRRPIP